MVQRQFPQVPTITTSKLATWLASELPPPILIDVRQAEEYAVSHLPGALHLTTVPAIQQADVPTEAAIVVYCSVGYRSARLAQKLRAAGYQQVMNLAGSIFEWHNQEQPLVADGELTRQVHPYNRAWGLLLTAPE